MVEMKLHESKQEGENKGDKRTKSKEEKRQ
jgi:hypothetical protein